MSKAEERANERYPLMQDGDEEGLEALKYVGMECGSIYEYNSIKYAQQAYFIEGYHQAEKDLELSWDDISELNCLLNEVEQEFKKGMHEDKSYIGYCKEVLKRFKERKKREEI